MLEYCSRRARLSSEYLSIFKTTRWYTLKGGAALSGTLYLVGTPIGNLEDISWRAVRVLKEADWIACEDTRHTRRLLDHYGIARPTISYHEHNERERTPELIEALTGGAAGALVSDAGMPLISDPGYRLVRAAIDHGIRVEPIPGPSALLAALAASGLPGGAFHFGGFLPAKSAARSKVLEALRHEPVPLIFYEAPHRILETLEAIDRIMGDRLVVLARELTKVHEEFLRAPAAEIRATLAARPAVKGEITLVIAAASSTAADAPDAGLPLAQAVEACIADGMPRMDAIKEVARRRGLSKREVYVAYEEAEEPEN
jgi:16S rRNA (cytidine1402-2'-O)-methyltransferase